MLIHALLHLAGANITSRRDWLIPYFVAQGALIFTIVYMAPGGGFIYGLYWPMAGEAAMILADLRVASLTIVCYMALSAINFGLALGWTQLASLIAYIAPMTFFILVYALMFQRQAKARQQTLSLLAVLETAHRQLAEYAVQVESLTLSHERERRARELNDTLAQGLAGLILQLEAVDTHLARNQNDRAQKIVIQAMSRARSTLCRCPPSYRQGVLRAYVWNCDGGLTLNMKNLYRENAITLDLHEGPRKLPQVVSASGAKYSDGSLTFWTEGDTATLERPGSAPVQCREARYESLLAAARERGVRYRGRGNEPGWTVEIGPGTRVEFVTDYGQERRTFDAMSESGSETAGARVFRAEHGSQRIKVSVTTKACTDDMTDERFAQRMIVEFGGRLYRGCATTLQ